MTDPMIEDVPMTTDRGAREARGAGRHAVSREAAAKRTKIADERGLSREQMIAKFRNEMFANVMPTLPDIPGYHLCWLSTTNQYDSLAHREAIGYERVKPEDLPGFDHITIASGPYAGCIGLNELILAKIPVDIWHEYMKIAHDERPYAEEEKIREVVKYMQDKMVDGGAQEPYLGDGFRDIMTTRRRQASFEE